jgi:hypothetical protein
VKTDSVGLGMVLCIVALIAFSILSVGSAKYKQVAREALRCVIKNLTLSPCDVGLEQRIKGKITAKLLVVPLLARFFYRNFTLISWAFTISFFASLIYSAYSIYNFFVYGSCEPGGACVVTWIGWCILWIEKALVYVVLLIIVVIVLYLVVKRLRQ